ncbi:alanine dehydrogenase [Candidatus Methylomicrobium oryzae]|jgi:alanine dehydrogenase|uniref:alanine dehydrogenase n=1 Tax=Candidatus Methylomicrobium oryzae TaxID=2802053 RepID=UPI00192198D8|nr:alanine dehydrogenase [Methylomicrobium sp. RS1]MBL1265502.1 alanine dehydrogenase [Methylomicrobium sp. RS1]
MLIGLPKEIKNNEYRVGLTPGSVSALIRQGHQVKVQSGAGIGSSFTDTEYLSVGAEIVMNAEEAWKADLVVKVKEPIEEEYRYLKPDVILFTYLHLASSKVLTEALLQSGITSIAYETVQTPDGRLPLLMPMSEVAGRMAAQAGATYLQKNHGGRGILISGIPGVPPANVVILGAGIAGSNAARVAVGFGALTTVLDVNYERLKALDDLYRGQLQTRISNNYTIEEAVYEADLVIGAVLIPGAKAPWLIRADMLKKMRKGAVIVDVSIDQGGCVETARPTTHSDPTYEVDGIVHYCVANMPGAVPRTSTLALNNATLPYVLRLANEGLDALRHDHPLQLGLTTHQGRLTNAAVAQSLDFGYTNASACLMTSHRASI